MNEKELLEYLIRTIELDLIVWKDGDYYKPKGTKQELYKKIYEMRELVHLVKSICNTLQDNS